MGFHFELGEVNQGGRAIFPFRRLELCLIILVLVSLFKMATRCSPVVLRFLAGKADQQLMVGRQNQQIFANDYEQTCASC